MAQRYFNIVWLNYTDPYITQDTVLSSISAVVLFSLAVSLATVIDGYATLLRMYSDSNISSYRHPTTAPAQAVAVSMSLMIEHS